MKDSYINRLDIKILIVLFLSAHASCRSFIEVDPPANKTSAEIVFSDDGMTAAVMTGVYARMNNGFSISGGTVSTLSLFSELAGDNLRLSSLAAPRFLPYYRNQLTPLYPDVNGNYWTEFYSLIYPCNGIIENVGESNKLSQAVVKQATGEAYFVRAFLYFYLVNMYEDVPLVLNSDYSKSRNLPRTEKSKVYTQIISDLNKAVELLSEQYVDQTMKKTSSERVRPNKFAAMSLLSRVYLYTGDYQNAEKMSGMVIANKTLYDTVSLSQAFKKNTKETIWALQPVRTGENTQEGLFYILPPTGPAFNFPAYISPELISSFESGDGRLNTWIQNRTLTNGTVYPYPAKYRINTLNVAVDEYSIVLRIAEQYLIRAEARAQLDRIADTQADLNVVRRRANLSNTLATDKPALLNAVFNERRVELFTEWGHRWFDLKRTGRINDVMKVITSRKGGAWKPEWQTFPIPQVERERNPVLSQNEGYEP